MVVGKQTPLGECERLFNAEVSYSASALLVAAMVNAGYSAARSGAVLSHACDDPGSARRHCAETDACDGGEAVAGK